MLLAAAALARQEQPAARAGEQTAEEPASGGRDYQILVGVGAELPMARAVEWLDGVGAPTPSLRVERAFLPVLPGAGLYLGGGVWHRGSNPDVDLGLLVLEAETGVVWRWPARGL